MQAKELSGAGERLIDFVFERGEDVIAELTRYAQEHDLESSRFAATGSLDEATLGYIDSAGGSYRELAVIEQVEVLSLIGDIVLDGTHPRVHARAMLGRRDGSICGGYLLGARVRRTMEVVLIESPRH